MASSESLLQILGRTERTTKATCQNEVSSRSHAILQLSVSLVPEHTWQQVRGLGLGLGLGLRVRVRVRVRVRDGVRVRVRVS